MKGLRIDARAVVIWRTRVRENKCMRPVCANISSVDVSRDRKIVPPSSPRFRIRAPLHIFFGFCNFPCLDGSQLSRLGKACNLSCAFPFAEIHIQCYTVLASRGQLPTSAADSALARTSLHAYCGEKLQVQVPTAFPTQH